MPMDEELVAVYESDRPELVAIAKMALQGGELPCLTANEVVSSVYPTDGMAIVRLQVFRRDAERARELLAEAGLG